MQGLPDPQESTSAEQSFSLLCSDQNCLPLTACRAALAGGADLCLLELALPEGKSLALCLSCLLRRFLLKAGGVCLSFALGNQDCQAVKRKRGEPSQPFPGGAGHLESCCSSTRHLSL